MQERTPEELLQLIQDEGVELVDFRFCDLPGLMQHFSMPAGHLDADAFVAPTGTPVPVLDRLHSRPADAEVAGGLFLRELMGVTGSGECRA
jgi:glutamine synthetase